MSRAPDVVAATQPSVAPARPRASSGDGWAALPRPPAPSPRRRRRRPRALGWTAFAIAALVAIAALAWVTASVLALEQREALARAETAHQQTVRLALWHMDSWMTPRLAAEAARPYFHYLAFYPPKRAYDQYLSAIAEGEVLAESPLLRFRDDVIQLHLQVDLRQQVSSPQVPQANERDLAEGLARLTAAEVEAKAALLRQAEDDIGTLPLSLASRVEEVVACQTAVFEGQIDPAIVEGPIVADAAMGAASASMEAGVTRSTSTPPIPMRSDAGRPAAAAADAPIASLAAPGIEHHDQPEGDAPAPPQRSVPPSQARTQTMAKEALSSMNRRQQGADSDYARRLATSNVAQTSQWMQVDAGFADGGVDIGPFVPVWVSHGGAGAPSLYYFRRVQTADAAMVQGFLVDWPRLCAALRDTVAYLVPDATLVPVGTGGDASPPAAGELRLASIPARLVVPPPAEATTIPRTALTPMRSILGVAWLALLAAVAAAGLSLSAVQSDAARRARFAGTVTHELRTPLTTFQLYTDLLADGMVAPERRGEYLATLRSESHRLGHLVENVLSYARIEQGRHVPTPVECTSAGLLGRVEPALRRRIEETGARLAIEDATPDAARRWLLDVDSVERILFNLVDNAAKYAVTGDAAATADTVGGSGDPGAEAPARITVRAEVVDDRLNLLVVDRGPGLPRDDARRLFRAFERGGDDHTQGRRGIGLGLALSRELARALGGELTHEPTPGGGATFRVVL